ncbi:MAG: 3-hydroxyacyl-CoA dehydrogenase family protein [Elusimicrobia bacterium]|nr:3-hydroxyacyl-CoA dehydrogenase family protein [Elusimicrobiota bacterium]
MPIEAVGIIGATGGGVGIAEVLALRGFQVRLYDDFKDSLNIALAKINWSLSRSGKGEFLANIEGVQDMIELKGADIIIEAASKEIDERKILFEKLKNVMGSPYIIGARAGMPTLASLLENTELPIDMTIGINFARPVKSNLLVELIRTDRTSDKAVNDCIDFIRKIGKTPVIIRDYPGAIFERLLRPFILSAFRILEAGKGMPDEIDEAVKECGGIPTGPFEIADLIGLDADYEATKAIYEALKSPERLTPSGVEQRLVQYGQLGKKSTIGIYIYDDGRIVGINPTLSNVVKYLGLKKITKTEIFGEIMRPVLEEAKCLASEVMASEYDIETVAKIGFGWPKGPFSYLREKEESFRRKAPKTGFENLETF